MSNKGKCTYFDKRQLVVFHHTKGKSHKEIAEILNMCKSTVGNIMCRFKNEDRIDFIPPKPREKKLTAREKRWIVNQIKIQPKLSAPKLTSMVLEKFEKTVNPETVRRTLRENGYHGRTARKKPYISDVNKKERVLFAKEHINKGDDFWKEVIFADETKINLFGSDGRVNVWRKANEELNIKNLNSTIKHGGGSVMIWGCMGAAGVGNLQFIEGIMKKEQYLNLLKNNLKQSAEKLGIPRTFKFYQDNDPKHTAHIVREYLIYNCPKVIQAPPQSPDINPIENLWNYLKSRVRKRNITSKSEIKKIIEEEWNKIGPSYTQKLISSMKNRLACVIECKGNPTKY